MTDLHNKVNKFESRWFVVILPSSWDAPRVWNHEDACERDLPPAQDIRRVYRRLINDLMTEGPVELSSLLSIENIQEAGWGVPVLMDHPPPPVFHHEEQDDVDILEAEEEDEEDVLEHSSHTFSTLQEDSPKGSFFTMFMLSSYI